jgi:hypothetical protein
VLLTIVVGRSAPFHRTIDEGANPLPFTVNVNSPPPVKVLDGDNDATVGTGFGPCVTVTVGLVAARVNPLFGNSRNSYVPGVVGICTVHVRVVTPPPT